jgi:hypothetical protein
VTPTYDLCAIEALVSNKNTIIVIFVIYTTGLELECPEFRLYHANSTTVWKQHSPGNDGIIWKTFERGAERNAKKGRNRG